MDWPRLADFIRAELRERGWRQIDLAEHAGVTFNSINTLLNGPVPSRWPTKTITGVEHAFGWEPGTARHILEGGHLPEPRGTTPPDLRDDDERELWAVGEARGWPEADRWQLIIQLRTVREIRRRSGS